MLKILIEANGGPEVLKVIDVDEPSVEDGHVLVQVEASGVNFLDIYQRQGILDLPKPFTPGLEGVGVVKAVGSGVDKIHPGMRVAWINTPGSYAETVLLPVEQAIVIPETFELRDSLLFQAVTAQCLVKEYRNITAQDTVLIHAAAGGVGQFLVQWVKHLGARVIATASSVDKLKVASELGADVLINYTEESFKERVLAETSGAGVDLVFDSVGARTFTDSVASLTSRGTAVLYGFASGAVDPIDIMPLVPKAVRVATGSIFAYISDSAEMQRRAADVITAIQRGWIRAAHLKTFSLTEAPDAHHALESRKSSGKLALLAT